MSTAVENRSLSEIVQDILRNVQDIVSAEVRLAKAEIQEEIAKTKSSAILLGTGALGGFFALLFCLLAAMYGLTLILPIWAAALTVAAVLGVFAALTVAAGLRRLKQIRSVGSIVRSAVR